MSQLKIETYQEKNSLLELLRNGQTLTTKDIKDLGVARPSARIHDLRKAGFNIVTTLIGHKAAYHLAVGTDL